MTRRGPIHLVQRLTIVSARLEALSNTSDDRCSVDNDAKRAVGAYLGTWVQPHVSDSLMWASGAPWDPALASDSYDLACEMQSVTQGVPTELGSEVAAAVGLHDPATTRLPVRAAIEAADQMLSEALRGSVSDTTARRYAVARHAMEGQ